jgi:hypothetical protein
LRQRKHSSQQLPLKDYPMSMTQCTRSGHKSINPPHQFPSKYLQKFKGTAIYLTLLTFLPIPIFSSHKNNTFNLSLLPPKSHTGGNERNKKNLYSSFPNCNISQKKTHSSKKETKKMKTEPPTPFLLT